MNYLDNYLKIIPEYDMIEIEKALKENEKHFGLEEISEYEFKNLIKQLSEQDTQVTQVPSFGEKIESEKLNQFYSTVAIDLKRLFSKQESIEVANENYHHVYKSTLDEITRAAENLERHIEQLKHKNSGDKGLVIKKYGFEPEYATEYNENYNKDTEYLFVDRDGSQLTTAETNRFYHNYSLTLSQKDIVDALKNDQNISTATIEIEYQTPGVYENNNPKYSIKNAIDGTSDTYWFTTCFKSNNDLDKITIGPKRGV